MNVSTEEPKLLFFLRFFLWTHELYECQNTTLAIYLSLYSINLYLRDNYSFILVLKVGLVALFKS